MKLIDEEGIIKLRNLIKSDIQEVRDEIPDFPKDAYPIEGSHNPIESGGVYDALADKQDVLTFDNTPTANSENPVKSGGVYQVVTGKQDRLTFDEVPTLGSQNMVRSGAIALALNNKNDMATPVDTISSSVDNPVKSSAIYEALQGKQDTLTFDAVPTEGSDNVVSSNGIYEALSHAGGTPDWNQDDSNGVGYIKNRTHYIEYTFSEKLIDANTIDWNDSSTSTTIGGLSYKLIYTLSSNIKDALRTTGKFRVSFGSKYAIASSTYSSNAYRTAVEDLGLYIITTSSTIDVYVNWKSPSQLLTIEKVISETYHKLDNNYLDISTTPTSGSVKPISSGAVYTVLQDTAGMPDWWQDDSTQRNYIKHRTHYTTYEWSLYKSSTLTNSFSDTYTSNNKTYYKHFSGTGSSYAISAGTMCKVNYLGKTCQAYFYMITQYGSGRDGVYELNASDIGFIAHLSYERDIYTFSIYTSTQNDTSTFQIYRATNESVVKLPQKYIDTASSISEFDNRPVPANVVYTALQNVGGVSDWDQNNSQENDYVKNRTHYSVPVWTTVLDDTLNYTTVTYVYNGVTYYRNYYGANMGNFVTRGNRFRIIYNSLTYIGDIVYSNGVYILDASSIGILLRVTHSDIMYSFYAYTPISNNSSLFILDIMTDENITKLPNKYLDLAAEPQQNGVQPITSGGVYDATVGKEDVENKVTQITSNSTDIEYPSALAVWKLFNDLNRRIARLEAELGGGTSAIVEDNILEVFNGEENDNILELDDRSYVDENNILNFINSSSTASVDNNILTDDSISVDNGILNVPNATVDDSMIDLG